MTPNKQDPNMTTPRFALSVVIPVFNSAGILESLITRLLPVLEKCASQFEGILVDEDAEIPPEQSSDALGRP